MKKNDEKRKNSTPALTPWSSGTIATLYTERQNKKYVGRDACWYREIEGVRSGGRTDDAKQESNTIFARQIIALNWEYFLFVSTTFYGRKPYE